MFNTMYLLTVMFFVLCLIDIVLMALCARYIDNGFKREKAIKLVGIKAGIMAFSSGICLIVSLSICFGW